MENNQELLDKLQESIDLHYKQIETMTQMRRLVMLSNIMDMPIKEITGKVSTSVHAYGRPLYSKPWLENEFVIKLDGDEVARKKLINVPLEFWPDDVRAEYERVQRRKIVMREA
jgi:hypothetical protein